MAWLPLMTSFEGPQQPFPAFSNGRIPWEHTFLVISLLSRASLIDYEQVIYPKKQLIQSMFGLVACKDLQQSLFFFEGEKQNKTPVLNFRPSDRKGSG